MTTLATTIKPNAYFRKSNKDIVGRAAIDMMDCFPNSYGLTDAGRAAVQALGWAWATGRLQATQVLIIREWPLISFFSLLNKAVAAANGNYAIGSLAVAWGTVLEAA